MCQEIHALRRIDQAAGKAFVLNILGSAAGRKATQESRSTVERGTVQFEYCPRIYLRCLSRIPREAGAGHRGDFSHSRSVGPGRFTGRNVSGLLSTGESNVRELQSSAILFGEDRNNH